MEKFSSLVDEGIGFYGISDVATKRVAALADSFEQSEPSALEIKTANELWLPSNLTPLSTSTLSTPVDKIDFYDFTVSHSTQLPSTSSELPFQGPLNHSLASRSFSSRTSATISSPNDSSFFTTDTQQPWLSQPPPQRHTPVPSQDFHRGRTDFVLFPSSAGTTAPARRSLELAPAAHRAAPNSTFQSTANGQNRRNSTHFPSEASVQNPRVTEIIQGTGHNIASTSYNHRFSSPSQKSFYASSAPSSSAALPSPQEQKSSRPQVPLFTQSTGNIHVHKQNPHRSSTMVMPNAPQGTYPMSNTAMSRSISAPLNQGGSDMNMFNFTDMGAGPTGDPELFDGSFDMNAQSSFNSSDDATVSPQDLFKDPSPSAPPSSAFTNLTSPSWDSPDVTESFDTSPLFYANDNELGAGDKWFPLFPGDNTGSDESPPTQTKEVHDRNSLTSEARRRSSPSDSPYGRSAHAKHSSVSGVGSRRRDRPLPDIRPEDAPDAVTAKRVRNTLAARKSRMKKVEKFDLLEKKIADLTDEVEYWKNIAQNGSG